MNENQEHTDDRRPAGDLSLFLAGDAIITVPWREDEHPRFRALIEEMRAADATVINLETLIHEFRGYAQADSGGAHLASPPAVADDLAWAGVDMVAHANNHTFDYGSMGVLETNEYIAKAGIVLAGSGADLQNARAARYFRHPNGKVGLVAMASSFAHYGKASLSRPDVHGRPGLNPLSIETGRRATIPVWAARSLARLSRSLGRSGWRFERGWFRVLGHEVRPADGFSYTAADRIVENDHAGNLAALREARAESDIVILSLHNHRRANLGWLSRFAYEAIDEGVDIFFVQGEHRVGAIEIYKGRPILHGLGDFAYQVDMIERFPTEFYEGFGLDGDTTREDAFRYRDARPKKGLNFQRETFEGAAALIRFEDGVVKDLTLLPLDLNFDAEGPVRGRAYLAEPDLGVRILKQIQTASDRYGTKIEIDEATGTGRVRLG